MSWKFNPFTQKLDYITSSTILVSTTAPLNSVDGQLYINSVTDTMYVYYAGTWQELHTLVNPLQGPDGEGLLGPGGENLHPPSSDD